MKICILTHSMDVSAGWGRYSNQLISGLRERGHDVLVLTERGGEYPILRRGFGMFLSAIRTIPYIRRCDVIHALDVYPFGIIVWLATRFIRRPYFVSGVGTYSVAPLKNKATSWMARAACRNAVTVLAISSHTASQMKECAPDIRIRVVNPGISIHTCTVKVGPMSSRIISVGALKERKGYHIALEAFSRARKKLSDLTYTIIGDQRDKRYFKQLQQQAVDLGIADLVTFKQHLSEDELLKEYESAGLFLLPSINSEGHFEGFGLVFLEAASFGLPVIGTTHNGIADAVGRDNGILVPQEDIDATTDAIVKIFSDDSQWHKMSDASIAWAGLHPSSHMIDAYERAYQSELS